MRDINRKSRGPLTVNSEVLNSSEDRGRVHVCTGGQTRNGGGGKQFFSVTERVLCVYQVPTYLTIDYLLAWPSTYL